MVSFSSGAALLSGALAALALALYAVGRREGSGLRRACSWLAARLADGNESLPSVEF